MVIVSGVVRDLARWQTLSAAVLHRVDHRCVAASREFWRVQIEEGRALADRIIWSPVERADPLPFAAASDVEYGHPRRLVHKVASGWLVAFDHGEFGASVWWLNRDNTARRRISDVNVREFVALPAREGAPGEDLFVVTRPARPDGDTSILRASEAAPGEWTLTPIAQVEGYSSAAGIGQHDSILIVTSKAIARFDRAHGVTMLAQPRFSQSGATSVVEDDEGRIYAGLALGVGRLTPTPTGYRDDWLVPPGCRVDRRLMDPRFPIEMCVCTP